MTDLFDLGGKIALVTGASRGIGRAIALRLAEHGAAVTVSSRKLEACEAVVADITASGGRARAQACHIGHRDELAALVQATVAAFGGIDILVCNAAINPHFGPAATISDDAFDRTMASNVRSNFQLANMVLPGMAAQGGGSIIVISSIAGLRGSTDLGVYALSKAAELQLVRNIAVEWGPHGIRANAIAPGLVRTGFARALWEDPERRARRERETPLQRLGEPDDIAGAAVFLASPAARFMTGQTLVVDGGVTVGAPRA